MEVTDVAVVHEQPAPEAEGMAVGLLIGDPIAARTCTMNMGDSVCAASSRRFASPQAGATLW